VPASLLAKSRDHFAKEAPPLRLHSQMGAQILAPIHFLTPAAQMVRAHHERWDGLGYPDGLRHEDIPLGARLLSIANAYVGMTETLTPSQAAGRLCQAAGARFDPDQVEVLARLLAEMGELEQAPRTAPQLAGGRLPHWML
jgi:HD-GYP domain-containing protein (c-di-GMP phosphodiesterase class II)